MKNAKTKKATLVIVALILVALTVVSATYAWIDDVKLVEFDNTSVADDGAPLKTGVDINSTVNITKNTNEINLGNMLTNDDLTYEYTDNNNTAKRHTKYDGNNNARKPDWDCINDNKGYFYESGDMHLSPCYSDGETFYFPQNNSNDSFREGNKDDENVNYISFTTKVASPDANVDFWFKELPTVYVHGSTVNLIGSRFAITVDGQSHVYSNDGKAYLNSTTEVDGVRKTSSYTYDNNDNFTTSRGKNSNVLFSVKKGATVNLNVKIWVEPGNLSNVDTVDVSLKLISSWAFERTITVVDRTTTNTKKSWLNDDSATMFLTCPSVLEEYAKKLNLGTNVSTWQLIRSQSGYNHAPFFALQRDASLSTSDYDVFSVTMPMVYNTEEMIIYRCSNSGWNKGDHSGKNGDHGVNYWNWWKTAIPNTYTTGVYTLYGGSHDEYAGYVVTDDSKKETYLGYGTWGEVDEISVDPNYHEINWASKDSDNDNVYIRDYSDFDTTGETYVHSMYWNSTKNLWTACIPKSSSLIQFLYTQKSNIKGCFGYNSHGNYNPQMRPSGDLKYHFAFKNDKSGNVNGIGYWSTASRVYLIKNGDIKDATNVYDYIFYKYVNNGTQTYENATWRGKAMTKLSDVKYQDTYDVYKSEDLSGDGVNNMYPDRRKCQYPDDSANNIPTDLTVVFNEPYHQTGDLTLFPGCYFDYASNKWLGSLTGTGRSAVVSDDDDDSGSGDTGGGDISGYTQSTDFVFKLNNKEYAVKSNGSEFAVSIPLSVGDNWTTVQKSGTNYGLQASGQYYSVPNNNLNLYLTNSQVNNFSLRALTSGNYIVKFTYDNGNQNTIKLTSCTQ